MRAYPLMLVPLLTSLALSSCTTDLGPPNEPWPVATVSVEPATAVIAPGTSIQLSAIPRDPVGAAFSGLPTSWITSNGSVATVGAGGIVTGMTAGSVAIIATIEGKSDTAVITVSAALPATPVLEAVILAPSSITLQAGATQQFAASGRMTDGSTTPVNVTFGATGGAITSTGLYTAGSVAGSYRVIATQTGGTLADTATLTIAPANPTPPSLVAVVLTPPSVALQTGATQQFTATGRMSDGSTATVNVTYSATGGAISGGGLYTAGGVAGSYRVIATHAGGTLADTSGVTITQPAPTLVAVILTPASVALQAGATQQFAVSGRMSDGSTTTVNVNYSATGGAITGGGLYTAGSVGGTYRVISTLIGGTLADTSAITISAPGPCVGSATVVCPGESIAAKVNAAPPGTAFTIKAGVHRSQRINPKDGQIFTGEPGTILDGEGVTQFAFEGSALGVQIRNLEIANYVPGDILGAIQGYDAREWTLENLNVHHNAGFGANLRGLFTVRGGTFHHNSKLGIGVNQGAGALIEGVDLSYNNPNTLYDPLWEAGGIKIVYSDQVTVRGCHAHHNVGPGIWFDIDNTRGLVIDNLVTDNTEAGIFYEISYSGVIQGNTSVGNGTRDATPFGAGILVSSSQNVEVHHNTVGGPGYGIVGLNAQRGSGGQGVYLVQNLWVHDNGIDLPSGAAGLVDVAGDGSIYTLNNRFNLNQYNITGNPVPFSILWMARMSRAEWQARGQDANSTFVGP